MLQLAIIILIIFFFLSRPFAGFYSSFTSWKWHFYGLNDLAARWWERWRCEIWVFDVFWGWRWMKYFILYKLMKHFREFISGRCRCRWAGDITFRLHVRFINNDKKKYYRFSLIKQYFSSLQSFKLSPDLNSMTSYWRSNLYLLLLIWWCEVFHFKIR